MKTQIQLKLNSKYVVIFFNQRIMFYLMEAKLNLEQSMKIKTTYICQNQIKEMK